MKKRTRSILEELNSLGRKHNNDRLIESSASNIIESSINLIQKILMKLSMQMSFVIKKN